MSEITNKMLETQKSVAHADSNREREKMRDRKEWHMLTATGRERK